MQNPIQPICQFGTSQDSLRFMAPIKYFCLKEQFTYLSLTSPSMPRMWSKMTIASLIAEVQNFGKYQVNLRFF